MSSRQRTKKPRAGAADDEAAVSQKSPNGATSELLPFLKWPGGKRWFVASHTDLLPAAFDTYIEPFLGAGATFFHLKPKRALLGDLNGDLIAAYRAVKDDWRSVERSLSYRQRRHREDPDGYYYSMRERSTEEPVQRATRLIYLNRTCFNGIYRVNRKGQFNVPRGNKDKVIIESDDFESMSKLLSGATLVEGDFEVLVDRARANDFVFCDPPYTVRHNNNCFRKYNEVLFSWADQERLAAALERAARRGVKVLCTNANHESVRSLYKPPTFECVVVERCSRISADSASRGNFEELVVRANI